jgi:hypothetical protein
VLVRHSFSDDGDIFQTSRNYENALAPSGRGIYSASRSNHLTALSIHAVCKRAHQRSTKQQRLHRCSGKTPRVAEEGPQQWKSLHRGGYLGSEQFKNQMLEKMFGQVASGTTQVLAHGTGGSTATWDMNQRTLLLKIAVRDQWPRLSSIP